MTDTSSAPPAGTPILLRSQAVADVLLPILYLLCFFVAIPAFGVDTPRQIIVKAILEDDADKKIALINNLIGQSDPAIKPLLNAWKEDAIFLYKPGDEHKVPVLLADDKDAEDKQSATRVE